MSTLAKELMVGTRVFQNSSNELSSLVSNNVISKQMKVNTYTLNSQNWCWIDCSLRLCYQSDVNFGGFRSSLEASFVSSHTEEL